MDKVNAALEDVTILGEWNGEVVTCHIDIITAFFCGIEKRDITQEECD